MSQLLANGMIRPLGHRETRDALGIPWIPAPSRFLTCPGLPMAFPVTPSEIKPRAENLGVTSLQDKLCEQVLIPHSPAGTDTYSALLLGFACVCV